MIGRALRLPRPGFAALTRAKRATSQHFSLSFAPAAPKEGGCAAIVSKKTAARSVDRHLLKRRILSVVKPFCSPRYALVVYARAGSKSLPFADVKTELTGLLSALPRT